MTSRWDIERALRSSGLPPIARHLALELLTYAEARTAVIPLDYSPSLSDLASDTGLCRSSIRNALNRLEQAGWLMRDRDIFRSRTNHRRTGYALQLPRPPDGLGLGHQMPQARTADALARAPDALGLGHQMAQARARDDQRLGHQMPYASKPFKPSKPEAKPERARSAARAPDALAQTPGNVPELLREATSEQLRDVDRKKMPALLRQEITRRLPDVDQREIDGLAEYVKQHAKGSPVAYLRSIPNEDLRALAAEPPDDGTLRWT